MYAVIRAGGKQYRVAPGDVIRVEKLAEPHEDQVEFNDVLAVSGNEGEISRPQGQARVTAQVIGEVKGDKILVFHYKRKKQYKKIQGHRQPYTAVRITEIAFDGQTFKAPEPPARAASTAKGPKAPEGGAAPEEAVKPKRKASSKGSGPAAGAGSKTARFGGSAKGTGTSTKGGTSRKPKK